MEAFVRVLTNGLPHCSGIRFPNELLRRVLFDRAKQYTFSSLHFVFVYKLHVKHRRINVTLATTTVLTLSYSPLSSGQVGMVRRFLLNKVPVPLNSVSVPAKKRTERELLFLLGFAMDVAIVA